MGSERLSDGIPAKVEANGPNQTRPRINAVGLVWNEPGPKGGQSLELPADIVIGGQRYGGTLFVRTGGPRHVHISTQITGPSGPVHIEKAIEEAGLPVNSNVRLRITIEVEPA
jgi:hypothetical protein